ncbi:retrovirus-related pol polyprotein from transposon TNT 1-94 [Tanacetum coccineum]
MKMNKPKSATWTVRPTANYLYNVVDYYKNGTVDLNTRTFSCFKTSVWRASYNEVIYDVGHPSELIIVLPPVMDKRQPGRPRNRDRFKSKGEKTTPKPCIRCRKVGHNHHDCPSDSPSQTFIPTTSSVKSGSSTSRRGSKRSQESTRIIVLKLEID